MVEVAIRHGLATILSWLRSSNSTWFPTARLGLEPRALAARAWPIPVHSLAGRGASARGWSAGRAGRESLRSPSSADPTPALPVTVSRGEAGRALGVRWGSRRPGLLTACGLSRSGDDRLTGMLRDMGAGISGKRGKFPRSFRGRRGGRRGGRSGWGRVGRRRGPRRSRAGHRPRWRRRRVSGRRTWRRAGRGRTRRGR